MSYSIDRETGPSVVERSVRYAAHVDTLADAWAFVMEKLDDPLVGDKPTIKIGPCWSYSPTTQEESLYFTVVVDGWTDLSPEKTDE